MANDEPDIFVNAQQVSNVQQRCDVAWELLDEAMKFLKAQQWVCSAVIDGDIDHLWYQCHWGCGAKKAHGETGVHESHCEWAAFIRRTEAAIKAERLGAGLAELNKEIL